MQCEGRPWQDRETRTEVGWQDVERSGALMRWASRESDSLRVHSVSILPERLVVCARNRACPGPVRRQHRRPYPGCGRRGSRMTAGYRRGVADCSCSYW